MKLLMFVVSLLVTSSAMANLLFIVPAGAGTTSDIMARKLAQELETKTKQTVVVLNHPGGDQIIGLNRAETVTQPLLFLGGTTLHVFNPVFNAESVQNLDSTLDVFATVAHGPSVWYANSNSNIRTIKDLIQAFQQNQKINIGSDLLSVRINADSLKHRYQATNMQIVNYKASSQVLLDVAGGTVPIGVGTPTAAMANLISEGKIIALANTGDTAIEISNVSIPPLKNAAPQFKSGWFLSTSKKSPVSAETIKTLSVILQSPEFVKFAKNLGIIPDYQDKNSTNRYLENYRKSLKVLFDVGTLQQ